MLSIHLYIYIDPDKSGYVGCEFEVWILYNAHSRADGPSDGSLLPGDQIFEINGEDVQTVPRERVIELVRFVLVSP
jgi:hypothetical protein